MVTTELKEEKKGEYYFRIIIAAVFLILGVLILIDSVFLSKNTNGYQLLVGFELLAGSYLVITKNFLGFNLIGTH